MAAVGSFLAARARGGQWLLRIEDLDTARVVPGAMDAILRQLSACALEWDGAPVKQSARIELYQAALASLVDRQLVYPCACSRKEIADSGLRGIEGHIYPGTCRAGISAGRGARSWRVRVEDAVVSFDDIVQGSATQHLAEAIGDFVLYRADGQFAYQLAVVVDDAAQGITEVVRGADLLLSTPRQIYLQSLLGYPRPHYVHLPVAVNSAGEKLSKQTFAAPIEITDAGAALWSALNFLGQNPPLALRRAPARPIIAWALENWRLEAVPRALTRAVSDIAPC